jgi:hypothetical protein
MEESKLNHPWTIYHSEMLSSYIKYSIYYEELDKLFKYFSRLVDTVKELPDSSAILNTLIVGTPMECALQQKSSMSFQWQQLFPVHINDFVDYCENEKKYGIVNICIVSPDDTFMDLHYKEPLFTKCSGLDFTKVEPRHYLCTSPNFEIRVNIFTCPFPQLETRTDVIQKVNLFVKSHVPDFAIQDFTPNDSDIKFINDFYSLLETLGSNPKSNIIINSYATFRNVREYDNYGLFPSLLKFANKYGIIATEWNFLESNFKTKIVSKIPMTIDYINYRVSYVDFSHSSVLFADYEDLSVEKLRELKKMYNMYDLMEIVCIVIVFDTSGPKLVYRRMIK